MKLDWMMLANHGEVANGLLYIAGGTWDTTTVGAPLPPGAPEGVVALMQGSLVARVLFHSTETDREHTFEITVVDEDGAEVAKIGGAVNVARADGLPPGWDQGINMVIPLSGMQLARFGLYNISLQVDGQHVGDRSFRVIRGY